MSEDKLLRRNLAVYISNDFATKKKILKTHHDNLLLKYFARVRTQNAIRRKYFLIKHAI